MPHQINRRRYERFALSPMYTPVAVRVLSEDGFKHEGHAYDIGEGGVRFELDRAIAPGTPVAIQITLPAGAGIPAGQGRGVFVFANVIWNQDEDEPGPVRMAAAFSRFARAGDRDRLLGYLSGTRHARAA